MAEQVTKMEIKVDLQCHRCYKKIKKILCGIPQVKDQVFDEKKNTVTIRVVGGSPENVRQKILCKGRCCVQDVKILPEPPPKDDKKPKKEEDKKDEKKKPSPDPAPTVYVIGCVGVCPPCLNWGCGSFCPCNCHGGQPPSCPGGCGRPAHDCRCWKPPSCQGGCGRPAHDCRCGKPPSCQGGCGRPTHECRCRKPSHPRCCDRCHDGNTCSSWTPPSCDCGRPPVCTTYGHECKSSCLQM